MKNVSPCGKTWKDLLGNKKVKTCNEIDRHYMAKSFNCNAPRVKVALRTYSEQLVFGLSKIFQALIGIQVLKLPEKDTQSPRQESFDSAIILS